MRELSILPPVDSGGADAGRDRCRSGYALALLGAAQQSLDILCHAPRRDAHRLSILFLDSLCFRVDTERVVLISAVRDEVSGRAIRAGSLLGFGGRPSLGPWNDRSFGVPPNARPVYSNVWTLAHRKRDPLVGPRRHSEYQQQRSRKVYCFHCILPFYGRRPSSCRMTEVSGGRAEPPETRRTVRQLLATFTLSSAARRPLASFSASSLAQKCMKKRRGCSSSMWLWIAVTSMPLSRSALATGFTSLAVSTKSPVIAALPPPVGWKLMPIAEPIGGGTAMPSSLILSARGMP